MYRLHFGQFPQFQTYTTYRYHFDIVQYIMAEDTKEQNMGWTNFIIIPDWKLVIEAHRSVENLEDYIKEALDKLINNNVDIDIDLSDLKVNDITVKDLCGLASAHDNASSLYGLDTDKLFLYWLESKDIEYEIKSEFNIKLEEYTNNGYKIIRIWNSDDQDNKHENNKQEEGT